MPRTRASERPLRSICAAALLCTAAIGAPSSAQDVSVAQRPAESPATTSSNLHLNEVEIHGELEKPKIFFILPKAKRDSEARQQLFRFYPDILEPLDKDRFEEEARVLYQHGIPAE